MTKIKGIYTPVITIMKDDGTIDMEHMEEHINHLCDAGINGLLFGGSLGEFYACSIKEKKALIDLAVKTVHHRSQILIGVGSTIWTDVIELATYAEKVGADIINIVPPFYFGPTEKSIIDYYGKIAQQVSIPIQIYNFPARVGSDITSDALVSLIKSHPNIIGIKDTVDTISHTRKLITAVKSVRPDFSVLSGFDEYYLDNRLAGGDGVLCGLTNVVPQLFVKYHAAYEANDFKATMTYGKLVSQLMQIYDVTDLFIVAIKAAVKIRGLDISTYTRAPGITITNEEYHNVQHILNEVLPNEI